MFKDVVYWKENIFPFKLVHNTNSFLYAYKSGCRALANRELDTVSSIFILIYTSKFTPEVTNISINFFFSKYVNTE